MATTSKGNGTPRPVLKIEITFDGQHLQVAWPQQQPLQAFGMLEMAKATMQAQMLQQNPRQEGRVIRPAPGSQLPRFPRS